MSDARTQRILVIKLSALGDFIQVIGCFQAIRGYHRDAHITLLTTRPFVDLAEASGCFDETWIDERAPLWRVADWLAQARRMRAAGFDRVYDLQRQQRTAGYFHLLGPRKPEWVGIVRGCSHRYVDPPEPTPVIERYARMVMQAGIPRVDHPDVSFLAADIGRYGIEGRYALLVPGSSASRAVKRWPIENYAEVAKWLAARGTAPVLICGPAEREEARGIAKACQQAYDIETNIAEIAELARGAALAVANDTGPMHLIAAAGCPVVALFCRESNPIVGRPAGPAVKILHRPFLKDLPVSEVIEAMRKMERRI